ncbi:unnamed protein product [Thlaspi arvense]|uniref:Uncharacterized protein n=1 Tax=Thlaspi arvense TaxID=13288 RepID=A0AAU9SC60_THLAR|nr:unnamed protein product [Thlaspi arvense]
MTFNKSALSAFKRRVAYANVNFDYIVGWRTSSIRRPNELPKEMLHGLGQLSWEQVDVKIYWLHSDGNGKDVVFHMIDHFCL